MHHHTHAYTHIIIIIIINKIGPYHATTTNLPKNLIVIALIYMLRYKLFELDQIEFGLSNPNTSHWRKPYKV